MNSSIEIDTTSVAEVIDITPRIDEALHEAKIFQGICLVSALHTTTGLIINEAEPGLMEDMLRALDSLAPARAGYLHDRIDDNAHAHLQAMLIGNAVMVPIDNGRLVLGTWQRILLVELDGPRRRRVHLQVVS
ncbi:MAG TPA: secondary thiamine-phosphate synthase enzyme YjbQ [Methanotrichaceae archaeon]|nr:secondary thiamine-phosphate synthase enzyme YjbQ [Methanotrichaceae archaeon]